MLFYKRQCLSYELTDTKQCELGDDGINHYSCKMISYATLFPLIRLDSCQGHFRAPYPIQIRIFLNVLLWKKCLSDQNVSLIDKQNDAFSWMCDFQKAGSNPIWLLKYTVVNLAFQMSPKGLAPHPLMHLHVENYFNIPLLNVQPIPSALITYNQLPNIAKVNNFYTDVITSVF